MLKKIKQIIHSIKSSEDRFNKIDLTLLSNCILQKVDTLEKASVQELFGENNEL